MTPKERKRKLNRANYAARRAGDPAWVERRKQQSREYRERTRGPTKRARLNEALELLRRAVDDGGDNRWIQEVRQFLREQKQ